MESHEGLKYFFNNPDTKEQLPLGSFKLASEAYVSLYIGYDDECENILLSVVDVNDPDLDFYTREYPNKKNVQENIDTIVEDFDDLLNTLHEHIYKCNHCANVFSDISDDISLYGFNNKMLCQDCGIQNIYDKKFSNETCAVCLDNIGYGEVDLICDEPQHKLHINCGKTLDACPSCRKKRVGGARPPPMSFSLNIER